MWIELTQISPAARMSACSVCGSNLKEVPALSTGVHVEYEGIIEVCQRCIVEAASIFGMVEASSIVTLEAEIAELRQWADDAYAELGARQDAVTSIASALAKVAGERDALAALLNEVPA